MAEAPSGRKRAVPASRPKAAAPAKRPTPRKAVKPLIDDDEPITPNFALRLTEGLDEPEPAVAPPPDTFALRLNEALDAINAANGVKRPADDVLSSTVGMDASASTGGLKSTLAAIDKLPPIRLPIGPAIPWRVGLPALAALVVVMGLMSRFAGVSEPTGVQLPAQQPYAVQTEAPLFAKPVAEPPTSPDTTSAAAPAVVPTVAPQPVGVPEATAMGGGFDLMDIGIKLVAVLGLAYGSLMLLKRFGPGSSARGVGNGQDVRVISSIALAPNRSVHVIQVPGGKTLLVGATPNAVNLLAELPSADDAS